jgi:RNA polymerase sigma factor (sigma-70 family)
MATLSDAGAAPAAKTAPPLRISRLSDELLARQAARGSTRAYQAIYERYHQALYQYTRSILRHDHDAQDALQSTFTKALSALARGQRTAPLRPWLYRIAHNEAISMIRGRQRDQPTEVIERLDESAPSAEEEAAARERWSTVMADLVELPERQRGALLLRELSGLGHDEIAITLDTTTSGAKQSIFEARRTLAEFAEGREMDCGEVCRRISDGDGRVLRSRRVRAHLRSCEACAAFAAAIPARRSELRAMTPALPTAAAAALFARSLHAAAGHAAGGTGATTSSLATAGLAGKAAGGALVWKTLAGVAVVATTAAGVAGIRAATDTHHHASGAARHAHGRTSGQSHHAAAVQRAAAHRASARAQHAAALAHRAAVSHRHPAPAGAAPPASAGNSGKHLGIINGHGNAAIANPGSASHPIPASHRHNPSAGTRSQGHRTHTRAKKHATAPRRRRHGNSRGRGRSALKTPTTQRGPTGRAAPSTSVSPPSGALSAQ